MTNRRHVRESRSAAQQIDAIDDWWRINRPAVPNLFLDELATAYGLIRSLPDIGQKVSGAKSDLVRRILLRRSRHYVYYQESDDNEAIEVLAIWHTSRARKPDV